MGMKFAIDTNIYSEFNRGKLELREYIKLSNQIIVPLTVVGELRAGFSIGSRSELNEANLRRILDSPNVTTVTITDSATQTYSRVYNQLREAGTPVGTNDMWIAACCISNDLPLLTLDSNFKKIDELKLIRI